MGYRVVISDSADRDLTEIISYMVETLAAPQAATAFADALDEKYIQLEEQPLMFEECRNERLRRLGYRRFVVKNYIGIYQVDERKKEVFIARIFYGAREYERLL